MSKRTKISATERRRHDRSATLQWVGIGLVVALGLAAALLLTDGSGGTHVNAPAVEGVAA